MWTLPLIINWLYHLILLHYTCQHSCLRRETHLWVENFNLMPTHTYGPISNTWLKNVSYYRVNWLSFQKYVNSTNARNENSKWVNGNTFPEISDFWSSVWSIIIILRTSELIATSLEVFWHLQKSSESFRYSCVVFKNPGTPRIKISRLCNWVRKSWQVYCTLTNYY